MLSLTSRVSSALHLTSKPVETTTVQVPCTLPTLPPATYAAYHEPHTTTTVLDDFFGARAPDTNTSLYRSPSQVIAAPPPYAPYGHEVVERRPGVYAVREPRTLARMLFYYGFFFFPFWIVGMWFIISPMQPTEDWEAGKTEDEKTYLLRTLRATEKKWALRCLYAMFTLGTILAIIILGVKFAIRS